MIRVVVGPPCAGKSTYVAEHRSPGEVVVDFDALAMALGSSSSHAAGGAVREAAFAARDAAVGSVLDAGAGWIIHTSPKAAAVARYEAAGAEFVLLDPGADVCRARAAERPEGTLERIDAWYESPPAVRAGATRKGRGPMKIKSVPVQFKTGAEEGLAEGEFLVYPSTFTRTPDSYGDVVAPGAFAKGIAARKEAGITLPGLFGHRLDDPDFFVASAIDEGEDDHGWWVKGAFDMDSPKGPQVYRLVKSGRLRELSFAFDILDEGAVELEDGTKANELRDLDVFEFSFVPVGANRDTSVVAVKSAADALVSGMKLGRVLSAKNEDAVRGVIDQLGDAIAALEAVLPAGEDGESQEDSGGDDAGGKAEGAPGVKAETARAAATRFALANYYISKAL